MTPVAGIEIGKNDKGQDAFIRIDLKKYKKQLQSFLQEAGIFEDDFEKERAASLTEEKLLKQVAEHIKTLPWEK